MVLKDYRKHQSHGCTSTEEWGHIFTRITLVMLLLDSLPGFHEHFCSFAFSVTASNAILRWMVVAPLPACQACVLLPLRLPCFSSSSSFSWAFGVVSGVLLLPGAVATLAASRYAKTVTQMEKYYRFALGRNVLLPLHDTATQN